MYLLNDEQALVYTVDFITPPVDDALMFGRIAAANALSDVYAMGGTPLLVLNLVGFPAQRLPQETLRGVLRGALEVTEQAGATLAGGHSTDDEEPKFGLAVCGIVHPQRFWRNGGAQPGDRLLLTKPIGSGVLFNANRRGRVAAQHLEACLRSTSTLNRSAAEVLQRYPVHACTDISGFGLAGHAMEMARASQACFMVDLQRVPWFAGSLEACRRGIGTGADAANRSYAAEAVRFQCSPSPEHEALCFDPQTSGGLLVALPAEASTAALQALHAAGVQAAACIGEVGSGPPGQIVFDTLTLKRSAPQSE